MEKWERMAHMRRDRYAAAAATVQKPARGKGSSVPSKKKTHTVRKSSAGKPVPKKIDENGPITAPGVSTDVPVSQCLDFGLASDSPMELDFGPTLST